MVKKTLTQKERKKYTHFEVRKHVIVIRVNDSNRKEDIRVCNKLINYITLHYFCFSLALPLFQELFFRLYFFINSGLWISVITI